MRKVERSTQLKDEMKNIDFFLEGCCRAALIVVFGRAAPLGVEIDAVVVRVPSHVVPVHMGCHRQWRRHLHARSLVLDAEYLLHITCLLFVWTNFHVSFAIAAPTHAKEKARCVTLAQVRPGC